jgi:hypothetical protein
MSGVQNVFTLVVFGAVGLSLIMSLVLLVSSRGAGGGSIYDEIGSGGLTRDSGSAGPSLASPPDSPAAIAEQEREIRQMIGARSERLVARGRPPLDVDAEVARLMAATRQPAAHDAGLVNEVRQLVVARNERRVRQGLDELDVDAEVARTLKELEP